MSELPASYGDTTAEYLAARDGTGTVTGASAILWLEGPDAVSFLQGIITQDVEAMLPGSVARSLLLEPRGKLTDVFWVLRGENRVGIMTGAGRVAATRDDLARWMIRVKAEFRLDERTVVEIWGAGAHSTAGAAGFAVPDGWTDSSGVLLATVPLGTLPRVVVAGHGDPIPGTTPVGLIAATTVRIEAGEPAVGVDIDEKTIPQEAGIVDEAVSFAKGCYLGQELVARIDTRGHVNRHLRGVVIGTNIIPPVGARVLAGEKAVGTITSVGESLEARAPVAMALIRREVDPGDEVTVSWEGGDAPAVVRDFPLV